MRKASSSTNSRMVTINKDTPAASNHVENGAASGPPKLHRNLEKTSDYVKEYTLTESHRDGKSYNSNEYHDKTGEKLFVDPAKHEPRSSRAKELSSKDNQDYYEHQTIHEAKYDRRIRKQMAAGKALRDISRGRVVRHTNDKRIMLLHHNEISSTEARTFDEHNAVQDLTHLDNTFNYATSVPLHAHESRGAEIKPLSSEERSKLDAQLNQHMQNAKKALKNRESEKKLWWDPKKGAARPNRARDRQMAERKRRKEADKKAEGEKGRRATPVMGPKEEVRGNQQRRSAM
jgi:hypothetical protein